MTDEPRDVMDIRSLNARIRAIIESETLDTPQWIGGVISRLYVSDRGHTYFHVGDEGFSIGCFLRDNVRSELGFTPHTGADVEVYGEVTFYEQRGLIQINVRQMRLLRREMFADIAEAQKLLARKGLQPQPKNLLPRHSDLKKIGIVTSRHSQARHDFENSYRKGGGKAQTVMIEVRLQGEQAVADIADAIRRLNQENEVDVIVLTRGGGRLADLAIFDDAIIAEAIARSEIPVITGIGHDPDDTLADRYAARKASTPTDAGYILAGVKPPTEQKEEAPVHQWEVAAGLLALLVLAIVVIIVLFVI
jgi:exodeoxyribonuclease VII large subunit